MGGAAPEQKDMTLLSHQSPHLIASDSIPAEEFFPSAERRHSARDQSSLNPLHMILGLQAFDFLAPILIGFRCYQVYDASGPTFWAVCGKFCVVAAVLALLIFRLSGCYRRDLLLNSRLTLRKLSTGFFWLVWLGSMTAFLSKSFTELSRVWTVLWLLSWAATTIALRMSANRLVTARAARGDVYAADAAEAPEAAHPRRIRRSAGANRRTLRQFGPLHRRTAGTGQSHSHRPRGDGPAPRCRAEDFGDFPPNHGAVRGHPGVPGFGGVRVAAPTDPQSGWPAGLPHHGAAYFRWAFPGEDGGRQDREPHPVGASAPRAGRDRDRDQMDQPGSCVISSEAARLQQSQVRRAQIPQYARGVDGYQRRPAGEAQ